MGLEWLVWWALVRQAGKATRQGTSCNLLGQSVWDSAHFSIGAQSPPSRAMGMRPNWIRGSLASGGAFFYDRPK